MKLGPAEVEPSVWSGVKIGFGMFIVLPLIILAVAAAMVIWWLRQIL